MYKITIELFKVHKYFKVKFGLIYNKDPDPKEKNLKTINKFSYLGNDYLKFNPFPFITVDITSVMDKGETEYNPNRSFNMNRRELFIFRSRLKRLYENFVKVPDLFYYEGDMLKVNPNKSNALREMVICNNKQILMQACVVYDDKNEPYEGILLCVNTMDNFTYLTYGDIEYFLYELTRIDMTALAMDALNSVLLTENLESTKLDLPKTDPELEQLKEEIIDIKSSVYELTKGQEKPNEEIVDIKNSIKIVQEEMIPDI